VLLVRLAAPPIEGAANDLLVGLLAERLGVGRRAVRIISGARSRHKRLAISGITADRLRGAVHPTT
jgi:uncharacterized protein YggU (UPF0235/DUF167 family)